MYKRDKCARDRVMKSARLLLPYLKENETVVDIGCFTQEARKYYPRDIKYIGLDEKAYHRETVVVDLNGEFEIPKAKGVLCLETLEHLLRPHHMLERIHTALGPDGHLVVSLPNEATVFHRLRCLFGTVDGECFADRGKHLHLPSLRQARCLLTHGQHFEIVKELFYISPTGFASRQAWVGRILSLIPDRIHQTFADLLPSLFARGFIFLLKKKILPSSSTL